ncbi:hypothetical protein MCRY_21185 [Marivita cryptomonadis]|nr:hypothetical protein MCRY_21185 [Marivita cryptomonadis]
MIRFESRAARRKIEPHLDGVLQAHDGMRKTLSVGVAQALECGQSAKGLDFGFCRSMRRF